MIREWVLPGLLDTGPVDERIMAIQDGLVNFYVARGTAGLLCVDAGWRSHFVEHGFKKLGLDLSDVAAVFLTHMHWDHARCSDLYPNAQVFAGGGEAALRQWRRTPTSRPRRGLQDGQRLTIAGLAVRVIGTPGHTPDSLSYLIDERYLFTGDVLRLRRGKVAPFPSKFNHDRDAAKLSIRKLARIRGIECLLTAHTGTTRNVDAAFEDWREEATDADSREGEGE